MKGFGSVLAFSTLLFSSVIYAQGCPSEEPNNPYCQLPLYSDYEVNATFDDLALNSAPSDYQGVAWSGLTIAANSTSQPLMPASIKHYAHAQSGSALLSTTTDYIYLIGFNFGCSTKVNGSNSTVPAPCTLQVKGTCIPVGFPGWGGQNAQDLVPLNWTFKYTPRIVRGQAANLTYGSPYASKTTYKGVSKKQHPVLCSNYTLAATDATGKSASLYVDNVNMAIYTQEYY